MRTMHKSELPIPRAATLSRIGIHGLVVITHCDGDGAVKMHDTFKNLITQVGDQVIMERYANTGGPPATPTGMRLGLGGSATAASKTGAGAAIAGTYVNGSSQALGANGATAVASSLNGSSRRIAFGVNWVDSDLTDANPINDIDEIVMTNIAITDIGGAEANTLARAVITAINFDTADTIDAIWYQDGLGA